jgi:carbamate kinase
VPAIRSLVAARTVVVCAGGGGAPVVENDSGQYAGVEAVIDKDLTAALLARDLCADALLLLTDVPAVMREFGTPRAEPIRRIEVADLQRLSFPAGSMGPKIEACARFVETTDGRAVIGALTDAVALVEGTAGTTIVASSVDRDAGRFSHSGP